MSKIKRNGSHIRHLDSSFLRHKDALISDFRSKKHLYEEFSQSFKKLIETLLTQGGFKYQFKTRLKDTQRLEEKIVRKYREGKKYKSLNDIEDLVGLRIIFYTTSDINVFAKLLKKEISADLHFEERRKKSGYEAIHIIAQYGKKRLQLAEYKAFAGLKCEIQLVSIMHHAWAELEHDLIYKDINELEKTDPNKFIRVKKGLGKILEKYIRNAAVEFEKIVKDIRNP